MAQDFSYESDISPMAGRLFGGGSFTEQLTGSESQNSNDLGDARNERNRKHFQALDTSGLNDAQRIRYKMQALTFTDQLDERRIKREKNNLDLEIANQRAESNRLAIIAARDKNRREREANGQIDTIVNQLKGIRDNPELTELQKRDLANDLALDNGRAIASSPIVNGIFGTAMKGFDSKIQDAKSERAEKDRLLMPLINNGMSGAARKLVGDSPDERTQKLLGVADAIKKDNDEKLRYKQGLLMQKDQEGMSDEVRKNTLSQLDKLDSLVNGLEFGVEDELSGIKDMSQLSPKGSKQLHGIAKKIGIDTKGIDDLELLEIIQDSLIEQRKAFSIRQDPRSGQFVKPDFVKPIAENENKFFE